MKYDRVKEIVCWGFTEKFVRTKSRHGYRMMLIMAAAIFLLGTVIYIYTKYRYLDRIHITVESAIQSGDKNELERLARFSEIMSNLIMQVTYLYFTLMAICSVFVALTYRAMAKVIEKDNLNKQSQAAPN